MYRLTAIVAGLMLIALLGACSAYEPTPTLKPTATSLPPTVKPATSLPSATPTPTPHAAAPTPQSSTYSAVPTPSVTSSVPRPRPTDTPTPRPTSTPTPAPTPTVTPIPVEYTAGLGYARAENLIGSDADNYAQAFAKANLLGMSNTDARNYASGLIYHIADAIAEEQAVRSFVSEYQMAFEESLRMNPSRPASEAIGQASAAVRSNGNLWPFRNDTMPSESFAIDYAMALTRTTIGGLGAHGYALVYAGYRHMGVDTTHATTRAEIYAEGYAQSEDSNLQGRLIYARAYEQGHADALFRVERGLTRESATQEWASTYAGAYAYMHGRSNYCARGLSGTVNFNWAYDRQRYNFASIPINEWRMLDEARTCARLVAYGEVDARLSSPYMHASAYSLGVNQAVKRGLSGEEADAYTFNYYLAYYEKRGGRNTCCIEEANIYAIGYADARQMDRANADAEVYAAAYLEAFTSAKRSGSTDEEAHIYASAFAEAEAGS